jgi:hypothetical protein
MAQSDQCIVSYFVQQRLFNKSINRLDHFSLSDKDYNHLFQNRRWIQISFYESIAAFEETYSLYLQENRISATP